jgi:hypothetical protein
MRCNAGAALETETYLLDAKSGKIYDVPSMYRIR